MKHPRFYCAVMVAACISTGSSADEPLFSQQNGLFPVAPPPAVQTFDGFAQYRQSPDFGQEGTPSQGFLHYVMPRHNYTTWFRPRAATRDRCVRCAPDSFRPRGFGHLFARPCDGNRMDYSSYVLGSGQSNYGPSYYGRGEDPRCAHCDHTAEEGEHH